jgi:hypothetical protein
MTKGPWRRLSFTRFSSSAQEEQASRRAKSMTGIDLLSGGLKLLKVEGESE